MSNNISETIQNTVEGYILNLSKCPSEKVHLLMELAEAGERPFIFKLQCRRMYWTELAEAYSPSGGESIREFNRQAHG